MSVKCWVHTILGWLSSCLTKSNSESVGTLQSDYKLYACVIKFQKFNKNEANFEAS